MELVRRHRQDVLVCAATAIIAIVLGAWALQLWDWQRPSPWGYSHDAFASAEVVRTVMDHGWWTFNSQVGAPFGQHQQDFPVYNNDAAALVQLKLIGVVVSSVWTVLNLYYLLTFGIVAAVAFAVLRALGVSRGPAVVCAVLYSLLPYHFWHGTGQVFLASYYGIPIGVYLAVEVLRGTPLLRRREPPGRRVTQWVTGRSVATLAICFLLAASAVYYAVFTLILLLAATVARAVATGRWRSGVAGVVVIVMLAGSIVVLQAPSLLYWHDHGRNDLVAQRQPADSEAYALSLAQLLAPTTSHRIGELSDLTSRYDAATPIKSETGAASLGLTASIGLLWLVLVALAAVLAGATRRVGGELERQAAGLGLIAFIMGTVGGGGTVVAYLFSGEIRSWTRISTVIGFVALLGVALLLDRVRRRVTGRGGAIAFAVGLVALLVLGTLDQTSRFYVPDYKTIDAEYRSDSGFAHRIQATLPRGSMVYEMPYVAYPETPFVGRFGDYEEFRPYLNSEGLRWSYGAMKGRADDWQHDAAVKPLPPLLDGVVAAGFTGLYLDRFGWVDPQPTEAELGVLLRGGPAPMVSANGRQLFWDLRPYAARLRATIGERARAAMADATLHPTAIDWGLGFGAQQGARGDIWKWGGAGSQLTLVNPTSRPREVRVSWRAQAGAGAAGPSSVAITWPDGSTSRTGLAVGKEKTVARTVMLAPGTQTITLQVTNPAPPAADGSPQSIEVHNPVVVDAAMCARAVGTTGAARTRALQRCASGPRPQVP